MKSVAAILLVLLGLPSPGQEVVIALRNKPASGVTFTHIRGGHDFSHSTGGSSTSCSFSLGAAPAAGHIVFVGVGLFKGSPDVTPTTLTVADGNSNSYTVSSPVNYTFGTLFAHLYGAYFIVSGTPSATINMALTGSGAVYSLDCWGDEFSKSSGTITFDSFASASGAQTCSGTSAAAPSITAGGTPGLLYGLAVDPDNSFTDPAAGATLGAWTGTQGGPEIPDIGMITEYNLASSGSTAVNYTCGASGDRYGSMVAAAH